MEMKSIQPTVIKIAETMVYPAAIAQVVKVLGGSDAAANRMMELETSPAEQLIETAGRICYRSYEPGMNPNVTKVRADSAEYFRNIIAKGDGSVMEHATVSFASLNVSRVFTHELVRHRVGVAISQESLRYVRPTDLGLWLPEMGRAGKKVQEAVEETERRYKEIEQLVDWNAMSFDQKKVLTSALRRMLPDGMATNVVWSANLRTLRHVISMRTDPAAEVEIRMVFDKVAEICIRDYPLVFQDFIAKELSDGTKSWKPTLREKV